MSFRRVVVLAAALVAGAAMAQSAQQKADVSKSDASGGYTFDAAKGKAAYETNCVACHQASGEGLPGTFAPLKGNPATTGDDPTLQLHTIINGAHGVKVEGKNYSGVMPPFRHLTDTVIANIANYERTSWGNNGKLVTPADVAAVRSGKAGAGQAAATTAAAASAPATTASAPAASASAPAKAASTASSAVASTPGPLSGDATAGKAKAAVCGACHGLDGNSTDPQYPKLAGQNEHYIVEQLQNFKSGRRKNAIMMGMASPLSPQDMHDIAAYFASQKVTPGVADEALVKAGGALYREGDAERGIPACMSCHGPDGRGNPGAPYPQLAGQHADYVQQALTAWHDGDTWGTNKHAQIMPSIAKKLDKDDIAAVASYIEGLHTHTGEDDADSSTAP